MAADVTTQLEVEIMAGRRVFATAQALLSGGPIAGLASQRLSVGWHNSSVNSESGSFAVVAQNGGLDDLVGEIVSIKYSNAIIYAYVLTTADVPVQLSVTRRLFLAMNRLTLESITADVRPVESPS
jgi:hypothetical protein